MPYRRTCVFASSFATAVTMLTELRAGRTGQCCRAVTFGRFCWPCRHIVPVR